MPQFKTLEEYAEHIRVTTGRLSAQAFRALGTEDLVALAVARLHEEAADIVTGKEMEVEHEQVQSLDLSQLPLPTFAAAATEEYDPYKDE